MAYEKQTWQCGDTISAEKLNHMEDGISQGGGIETNIQNPTDGQTLKYDAESGKWVNGEGGSGPLSVLVTIDNDTYTFDKTWQEIYDAFPNVSLSWGDNTYKSTIAAISTNPYYVIANGDSYQYQASTPSGYPTYPYREEPQ